MVTYSPTVSGFPTPTVTCSPPSGSSFNVGTTTVNCSATNSLGTANCSFTVTVNDTQLPTITCPGAIVSNITGAATCKVVNYSASASDNCPGVNLSCVPPSGTCFPVGTTTVTCTATDASSNTMSCSFTVTISAFDVCIQSDDRRKILRFNSTTGDFQFTDCNKGGTVVTGKGTVTKAFCKIDLTTGTSKTGGATVFATANTCTAVGTAGDGGWNNPQNNGQQYQQQQLHVSIERKVLIEERG